MSDRVRIRIGDQLFEAWKQVSVSRSIESLCGTFDISLFDRFDNQQWLFVPNTVVDIFIGNDQVLRGIIDRVSIGADPTQKILSIAGRDQTSDLVDCSAMNIPGKWSQIDLANLTYFLCNPFGIKIRSDVVTDVLFDFKLQSGESPWEAINRANEFQGALIISDKFGRLVITKPGMSTDPVSDRLVYGKNISKFSLVVDYSSRYSEYTVKGQTKVSEESGWGTSERKVNFEATATDPVIAERRTRPKLFQAEGKATQKSAQNRVNLEASVRAARSSELIVTVQGWRQTNGKLWPINQYVFVDIPPARIENRRFIIAEVEYQKTLDGGSATQMILRREDAYQKLIKNAVRKGTTNTYGW